MKRLLPAFALLSLVALGCSSSDSTGSSSSSSSSSSGSSGTSSGGSSSTDCTFVTVADIQSVAGIATTLVPRDPTVGAGSDCNGNFAEPKADGTGTTMVLLIAKIVRNEFDNPSDLQAQVYPVLEQPTDLGAGVEAKLFLTEEADTGGKVLWLAKGEQVFALNSFYKLGAEPQLTKAQLLALGKIAATRFE